jgi:prephenate dehydratase
MKIGYLAPAGTFSDEAALKRGRESAVRLPFPTFKELIEAVISGKVHEVVIPSENLLISDLGENLDLIIAANGEIKVSGEIILQVRQNLIAAKNISLSSINKVVSIRKAIDQCSNWLEKNLPGVKKEYTESTATAIRDIEQFGDGAVAIGSVLGAETYGKKVIRKNIHDKKNNETHFYVIAKHDVSKPTGDDKTSLIFKVDNCFGALADILNIFKVFKINLTRIVSRSTQIKLGDYIFWIDIEGHRESIRVKEALKVVEEDSRFLKVLGSYPKAN